MSAWLATDKPSLPDSLTADKAHTMAEQIATCAWHCGDSPLLYLLMSSMNRIRADHFALSSKSVRDRLDPLTGHAVRLEDEGDAPDDGKRIRGTLERWAMGERESAREWARELDANLVCEEGLADIRAMTDFERLAEACAASLVSDGYAFALGLLLRDRLAVVQAIASMARTSIGWQLQRFIAYPPPGMSGVLRPGAGRVNAPDTLNGELLATAYSAAAGPWRGMFRRELDVMKIMRTNAAHTSACGTVVLREAHETCPVGNAGDWSGTLLECSLCKYRRAPEEAQAARERGFMPVVHGKIPAKAFNLQPSPTEQEV